MITRKTVQEVQDTTRGNLMVMQAMQALLSASSLSGAAAFRVAH